MEGVLDISETNKVKNYPIANRNLRFANYIIDSFIILGISILPAILFTFLSRSNNPIPFDSEQASFRMLGYVIIGLMTLIYYIISESYLDGKTIGKFITGTRAVNLNNQKMDFGTIVKRSFCRLVPFNALSFLGGLPLGWHDEWSNTKVILDKEWNG